MPPTVRPGSAHLESDLEKFLWTRVRRAGGVPLKMAPMHAGTPDRAVVLGGLVHLVELKADSGSLRPIQLAWHNALLCKTGVIVHVLRGRSDVTQWIRWVLETAAGETNADWLDWKEEAALAAAENAARAAR